MLSNPRWVLVVDDDDDLRDVMVETLEDAGYRAVGVASGSQALKAIHDEPFLVLADLRMPRMDGSELLNAMQAELGSRVPPGGVHHRSVAMDDRERRRAGLIE